MCLEYELSGILVETSNTNFTYMYIPRKSLSVADFNVIDDTILLYNVTIRDISIKVSISSFTSECLPPVTLKTDSIELKDISDMNVITNIMTLYLAVWKRILSVE